MKYHRFLWLFLLVVASSCSLWQKLNTRDTRLVSGKGEPPASLIAQVPFTEFTGGVLILKGRINNSPDTLNFILDTGSGGISLDSATCADLDLKIDSSNKFIRGIGGVRRLLYAHNNTLHLRGITLDSLDFHISDYAFISSVYGVKIDGIIGYSFFKNYIVKVNYDSMRLFVFSPGRYEYEKNGELFHPHIRNIPVISSRLKNKIEVNTRYYFDMGAGLCLMLSNRFADDSCLFCKPRQRRHKFIKSEAQGLIGKIEMIQTVVQELKIGKYRFRKVPTYLFDDVSNVTNYPSLGGLIGNDLLRRFNVTLNYPQNEIFISPNKSFSEPFDYSYTGLVMYFISGRIVITDITKGSPADNAGLKPDDVILAVNNNFSNNIQVYRELLKATGNKINVIILRDGQLKSIKLSIKSIL